MNILLCCDWDNGGQMIALKRALERYTEHRARLITIKQSYLGYETDVFDPTLDQAEDLVDWADFFILGEVLKPRMQVEKLLSRIDKNNCIVRAGGTIARTYPQLYLTGKYADIMKTGAYHDPTIASRIYPMAHTVNMYEFDEWPQRKKDTGDCDKVKLVFSGTAQKCQTEHCGPMITAVNMLKGKYGDRVEFVSITRTSWKECLRIKSGCDICFDQFLLGAYASSSIEGMFFRQPVFCYLSGWCKSIHSDVPLISVHSSREIFDRSVRLIENRSLIEDIGLKGYEYAKRVHSSEHAIQRWGSLIEFVSTEYKAR